MIHVGDYKRKIEPCLREELNENFPMVVLYDRMSIEEKQFHIRKEPRDWFLYQKIIFNTMMEELSYSYERPVTIGHFMGYTPEEIEKTIEFF